MAGCVVLAAPDEVPLMEAAMELGMKYPKARDLLLSGSLTGRKDGGYWLIERESVDRYKASRQQVVAA